MDILCYVIAAILFIIFISFFYIFIDLFFKFDGVNNLDKILVLVKYERKKYY